MDYEVGLAERLGLGERTAGWGRRSFGRAVAGVRARSIAALQTFFYNNRPSLQRRRRRRRRIGNRKNDSERERESLSDIAAEEKKNL